jgi:hypothetical protein
MGKADYDSVCDKMRLAGGTLWPMPITLDVAQEFADKLKKGDKVALRDGEGVMLAVITVDDIWTPDREAEAKAVFGTTDKTHPAVAYLMNQSKPVYIGGQVEALQPPLHYDYRSFRQTPAHSAGFASAVGAKSWHFKRAIHIARITSSFAAKRRKRTARPSRRGHDPPGDVDHYTRALLPALMSHYPQNTAFLSCCRWPCGYDRSDLARDHPQESRLHAFGRRPRSCWAGQGLSGNHSTVPTMRKSLQKRRRARRQNGRLQADGVRAGRRATFCRRRAAKTLDISGTELRSAAAHPSPAGSPTPKW